MCLLHTANSAETYFIVSMVENRDREVQDVLEDEDGIYAPLLDDLDLKTLMADGVDCA